MPKQNGVVHRYCGAEHHHGYHGHRPTDTDGSGITDVEGTKNHADLAFQCRLYVSFHSEIG